MMTAVVAMLSILVGLAVCAVIGIGVIASQLADLKAYTMTQTQILQRIGAPE